MKRKYRVGRAPRSIGVIPNADPKATRRDVLSGGKTRIEYAASSPKRMRPQFKPAT